MDTTMTNNTQDEKVISPVAEASEADALQVELNQLKVLAQNTKTPAGAPLVPGTFLSPDKNRKLKAAIRQKKQDENEKVIGHTVRIYQSYVNKSVLIGRVVSVNSQFERLPDGSGRMHYYAVAMYGPYQVYIPVEKFTETSMEYIQSIHQRRNPNITLETATERYLMARMGALIPFVVTFIAPPDEDGILRVGGSRVEAMTRLKVRFWLGTTTDGKPYRDAGSVIYSDKLDKDDPDNLDAVLRSARVVAVSAGGVRVELDGVETFIQLKELSWVLLNDARKLFKNGDTVDLKIMSVERKDAEKLTDTEITYTASIKEMIPNPRLEMVKLFNVNAIEMGKISFIRVPTEARPDLKPRVFVQLDKVNGDMQCMCPFPNGSKAPQMNKKVYVRIKGIDYEKGHLTGTILHIAD